MNTKSLLSILALVAVVLAGGGYLYTNSGKGQEASVAASTPAETTPPQTKNDPAPSETPVAASGYKDGTYSAEGAYRAPSGMETIKVSLTLKAGVITEANVEGVNVKNPETRAKQAEFIAGYKAMVIGKSIDEANLTKVSGSSLTSTGWNAALEKIKTEAKA